MDLSRRSFIRWVIASGAAMACPFPVSAGSKKSKTAFKSIPGGQLHSESNKVCHEVRDAKSLPLPAPDQYCDVVIVGGGPSGLAAADELKHADFVLLEKENHLGGNAYTESWENRLYSTGSAWTSPSDPNVRELAKRWNFDLQEIKGEDSACFEGVWIRNFWNGREDNPAFDQLPYGASVKNDFRRFVKTLSAIDIDREKDSLDQRRFSELFGGYPPQLKAFWDAFGMSDWGATSENTSAYIGIDAAINWFRDKRCTWAGGLGIGSQKILDGLSERARRRILTGAAVFKVRRNEKRVLASYFKDGKAHTIEAKAAVIAIPKFYAKFLVEGLPKKQVEAMSQMCYAPYLVYNLCFDRVVYNQGYDNWVVGAKNFTDFIPADWVTDADGGDLNRKQVITVYAPRPEAERADLLDDDQTLSKARAAVSEILTIFPSWLDHLREVRIYRRGHPMPMATPGCFTRLQPLARRDFPPIYFAHGDSKSEVSDFFGAARNGVDAARKASKH